MAQCLGPLAPAGGGCRAYQGQQRNGNIFPIKYFKVVIPFRDVSWFLSNPQVRAKGSFSVVA